MISYGDGLYLYPTQYGYSTVLQKKQSILFANIHWSNQTWGLLGRFDIPDSSIEKERVEKARKMPGLKFLTYSHNAVKLLLQLSEFCALCRFHRSDWHLYWDAYAMWDHRNGKYSNITYLHRKFNCYGFSLEPWKTAASLAEDSALQSSIRTRGLSPTLPYSSYIAVVLEHN